MNLASGESFFCINIFIPDGSESIFWVWCGFLMNLEPAAPRSLRVLGPNDFLAIWVCSSPPSHSCDYSSTRWNRGSLCDRSGFRTRAVTCSVKSGKAGHAPRVNLVSNSTPVGSVFVFPRVWQQIRWFLYNLDTLAPVMKVRQILLPYRTIYTGNVIGLQ